VATACHLIAKWLGLQSTSYRPRHSRPLWIFRLRHCQRFTAA